MNHDTLIAALVAAGVSLVVAFLGTIGALLAARWQVRSKLDEITQTQFKDVLAKRIEAYPRLWHILLTDLNDWQRVKKPRDAGWADCLLDRLNDWNARYGVFLSQNTYQKFFELRSEVAELVKRYAAGKPPAESDFQALDKICTGDAALSPDDPGRYGLATWLKNDLGSYKSPALAVGR